MYVGKNLISFDRNFLKAVFLIKPSDADDDLRL